MPQFKIGAVSCHPRCFSPPPAESATLAVRRVPQQLLMIRPATGRWHKSVDVLVPGATDRWLTSAELTATWCMNFRQLAFFPLLRARKEEWVLRWHFFGCCYELLVTSCITDQLNMYNGDTAFAITFWRRLGF